MNTWNWLKLAMVFVLRFVEDEQTFSMLAFMKDKLHNKLGLHLDKTIHMFAQEFYTLESFPNQEAITTWKDQKVQISATS